MTANDFGAMPRRWLWIASIWFGFGLIDAMQTVAVMQTEGMHHAWLKLFAVTVLSWLPWAVATPFVLRLERRWPAHLAACAAVGIAYAAWAVWLQLSFDPFADSSARVGFAHLWSDKLENSILTTLVLYAGVLTCNYALESRGRLALQQAEAAQLSERLSKAQLTALRRQIEPHFLFNTLSAIAGLVREGRSTAATDMIAALSDFLRHVLDDSTRQEVPLRDELAFAQRYLDIQKARFADRLRVDVDVPLALYPAAVPNLILQPLVENAVKHGIAKRVRGGTIRITASQCDGVLTLGVHDDGPSLPAGWETGRVGIGLSNVRARLHGLYGDAFTLNLRNDSGGGVDATVSIPLRDCPSPP